MKNTPASPPARPAFDPFAQSPDREMNSRTWLVATAIQGALTSALLAVSHAGLSPLWEAKLQGILILGIVATWSLALRTIRERLTELMRFWALASRGLLKRASQSGRHWVAIPLLQSQELYIKQAIRRLRIIACGLTIPFFVMPLCWSILSALLYTRTDLATLKEYWAGASVFLFFCALIVAGYLHWTIAPRPVPVRIAAQQRPLFPPRQRSR